jgi:hypothetical protein
MGGGDDELGHNGLKKGIHSKKTQRRVPYVEKPRAFVCFSAFCPKGPRGGFYFHSKNMNTKVNSGGNI